MALRDFGRDLKFCPLDGRMKEKSLAEEEQYKDKRTDELVMKKHRKVADTVIDMFKTEVDSPAKQPELGFKVPILDLSVRVEKV